MVQRLAQGPLGVPPPNLRNDYNVHHGKLCLEPGYPQCPYLYSGCHGYFVSPEMSWQMCLVAPHSQLTLGPAYPLSWARFCPTPSAGDCQGHEEQAWTLELLRMELGSQLSACLVPQLPHLPSRDKGATPAGLGRGKGIP